MTFGFSKSPFFDDFHLDFQEILIFEILFGLYWHVFWVIYNIFWLLERNIRKQFELNTIAKTNENGTFVNRTIPINSSYLIKLGVQANKSEFNSWKSILGDSYDFVQFQIVLYRGLY